MINIIKNMSLNSSTRSTEIMNKGHKKVQFKYVANWNVLHNIFYENHSIDDNIRFTVLKHFHSMIIIESVWYNYHSFTIIA